MGRPLRKGLRDWAPARDAAMAEGLGSSLEIPASESLNGAEQSGTFDFLAHGLRFEPRRAERAVLHKLGEQIDSLLAQSYGGVDAALAAFFDRIEAAEGNFTRLDPVELERMILEVQKAVYLATDVVAELYNDAYFADRVQQDEFWANYRSLQGDKPTVGDRQAHAYEGSRDSRWYYYGRYMLWRRMQEKLNALSALQRTLEFYRSRSIKTNYSG